MARVESTLNPNQFTIGWICALPVEKALATLMLDEDFGPRQIQFGPESHLYRLGCIGSHYVVIACILEAYGIAEANNTAVHLLRDFPSVKIGLLVGIGGGIPCHKDVRLGDVIVSQPDGGTHGGVVHYDFGKKLPGGRFERKGHLDKPPQALRTAVAAIADDHRLSGSQFEAYLNTTLRQRAENEQYSELLKNLERPQQDNLFHADYQHQSRGRRCDQCAKSGQVERDARPNTEPRIHYGTIASGSQVVKDAKTRDRLAKDDENILCIETEAAGLMNHFRCVVVRGVSDYADSHKNDDWHYYAAAIAAIYAKHLLFKVIAAEVDQEMSIAEVIYVSTSRQSSAPQRPYSPNYSALRLAQQSEEPGMLV